MNPNALTPAFWANERMKYIQKLDPLVLEIYMAGAVGGAAALPAGMELLINWDYFNQAAIAFLEQYGLSWATKISETTQRQAIDIIGRWIKSGAPFDILSKALGETLFSKKRAEMIATTEVTRIFAEGNIASWKATGIVSGKRWMTARDELVCPICAPLDGMVVELNENGFTTVQGDIGLTAPPAHVRCRCWLQPFVDTSRLEEIIATT